MPVTAPAFQQTWLLWAVEAGTTGIHQILASTPNRGEWPLPLTRADLYVGRADASSEAV